MKFGRKEIAIAVMFLGILCACATVSGAKDEKTVMNTLESWQAAVEAGNVEQMIALYSDQYKDPTMGDKAAARKRWLQLAHQGLLDGADVSMVHLKTSITGDTAVAAPLDFATKAMGYQVLEVALKNEGGTWRITSVHPF